MTQLLEPTIAAAPAPSAAPRGAPLSRPALPEFPGNLPPVIVLGGRANALSVARQIGRLGASVYALNEPGAFVGYSRYCRQIDLPAGTGGAARAWEDFLLGPASDALRGAVLLSCSDEGIELLTARREALAARYRLDDSNCAAQLAMLNKLATYRAAVEAGVPTPRFWVAESRQDVEAVRHELVFPLVVKPRLSHVFEGKTGKKLITVDDYAGVAAAVEAVADAGTSSVLMEKIPGPDDRLCSYFTYLDEDSRPMFHFTKRIIRRYPVLTGTGCYHVTDTIPEAVELANRLFRHVGLRGLANVEFKRDVRDGKLKLIECNARFTASDSLVARSGINLAAFVYCRLTGRPLPAMGQYRTGMRLWDPVRDFQAYLALRKAGELSFPQWLASVCHPQTFPYFRWNDPGPALARLTLPLRDRLGLTQ
jgi:predicted ATP-grasp superfamily ATP-dependent carboligase